MHCVVLSVRVYVVHMLWEAYSHIFVEKLLGDGYINCYKLTIQISVDLYVLGSELWEYNFDHLLSFNS